MSFQLKPNNLFFGLLLFLQCNHAVPDKYKQCIEIISYSPSIGFPTVLTCSEFRIEYEINNYAQIMKDTIICDKIFFDKVKAQFVEGKKSITKSSDIDVKALVKIKYKFRADSFFLALDNKIVICEEGYFESNKLWLEIQSVRNDMHN